MNSKQPYPIHPDPAYPGATPGSTSRRLHCVPVARIRAAATEDLPALEEFLRRLPANSPLARYTTPVNHMATLEQILRHGPGHGRAHLVMAGNDAPVIVAVGYYRVTAPGRHGRAQLHLLMELGVRGSDLANGLFRSLAYAARDDYIALLTLDAAANGIAVELGFRSLRPPRRRSLLRWTQPELDLTLEEPRLEKR